MCVEDLEYLCASHGEPRACNAISYATHSLDSTIATLTNPAVYPSRLSVSIESSRAFQSIVRRLNRIYSHAWYAHRDSFWKAERVHRCYSFFLAVVLEYKLLSAREIVVNCSDSDIEDSVAERTENSGDRVEQTDSPPETKCWTASPFETHTNYLDGGLSSPAHKSMVSKPEDHKPHDSQEDQAVVTEEDTEQLLLHEIEIGFDDTSALM